MYKLAIFDLDGTILNTIEDLTDSTNAILRQFGYPERTLPEVQSFVGNGIHKLIERAVPEGAENVEEVFTAFQPYYREHSAIRTRPYDGIPELLDALHEAGIRLAVVSNKADAAVQILCEKYFPGTFDAVYGERQGIARKPAPDSVNAVLAELGIAREQAVYIGDSDVDVQTAKNAGMDCIGVAWGFRGREFLVRHGAEKIVADAEELLKVWVPKINVFDLAEMKARLLNK